MKRLILSAALSLACLASIFAADIPDRTDIKSLSDQILLDWNGSLQDGDFSDFLRNDCATVWSKQTTSEQLRDTFAKQFGGQKIDLAEAIQKMEPTFEPEPKMTKEGDFDVLIVAGYYDTKPSRFTFQLKLIEEDETWKLVGINVKLAKPGDE